MSDHITGLTTFVGLKYNPNVWNLVVVIETGQNTVQRMRSYNGD